MSMMFTVYVYVLALKCSINVCYHKLNHLSLEMNEYFVIIAYSNNVYFSAILGTP